MRALLAFVQLGRPLFLGGGFIGFALGAAAARFEGAALDAIAYAWGQGLVTALHLMVHYANEYYDQAGDRLALRTPFSGGSGVLVRGQLAPRVALVGALVCAALGALAIARAALGGATLVAALGIAIGVLSWSYSAPPLRLLARGLGELDTVVVVGGLVPLVGFASFAGRLDALALATAVPGVCAMFAMMLCVEIPDRSADEASGKRTLVVRWGAGRALAVAAASALCAVGALVLVATATFGIAAALAVGAAAIPMLLACMLVVRPRLVLPAAVTPLLGVAVYATTALAGLVLIAGA